MSSARHVVAMLRKCVEQGEEARRLLAMIEAEDTPANDAPPKAKRLTRAEAETIAVRRLTESGALRKGT